MLIRCRQYINPKSSDFAHLLLLLLHVSRDALAKTARQICQKFLNCLAKKMENRRQNANYKEQLLNNYKQNFDVKQKRGNLKLRL
ncbi:putative serine/threonine-protein kinase [Trichinella spiralis]|uniref:Serine/threonine-protein kinase n=1 Tax=Trichinella spiralis TaxID=6334 RepID=A0ABR3KAB9_TRISP